MSTSTIDETMTLSPVKLTKTIYKEGMRVMFVNTINFRIQAFAVGTLGRKKDPSEEPPTITFDMEWEDPPPSDAALNDYFDNEPLILDDLDRDDEIDVRDLVHESRLVTYGAHVRDALTLTPGPEAYQRELENYGLDNTAYSVPFYAARNLITDINSRIRRAPQTTITQTNTVPLPMDLYEPIREVAMTKVTAALSAEKFIEDNPEYASMIKEEARMDKVSPLLKWAFEYEKAKAQATTTPVAATTSPVARYREQTTTTSNKPPPSTPRAIYNPPINMEQDTKMSPATRQDETNEDDSELDISDTISDDIPTSQSMATFVQHLRASKFGQLELVQKLKTDVAVMAAYVSFLLMILGRDTMTNTKMVVEHDWFATHIDHRLCFINGYYAAWGHRTDTWDEELAGTKKFKSSDAQNGMIAAMGTLTATTIRMTDEHMLRALAAGSGMTLNKVYHLLVGRPNYVQADFDACKVLRAKNNIGTFAEAEDGKGKLYDSIVSFLHNSEAIGRLRSQTMIVDFNGYGIPNELPDVTKNPPKKRGPAKRATKSPAAASPATKRSLRSQPTQQSPPPPLTRNTTTTLDTTALFVDDNQTADAGQKPAATQEETCTL